MNLKYVRIVALLFFALLFTNQAYAAHKFTYFQINKRIYEGGEQETRLGFGISDENGNPVSKETLTGAKLTEPDGNVIDLIEKGLIYDSYQELDGRYDVTTGIWKYDPSFRQLSDYFIVWQRELLEGVYKLEITLQNNEFMSAEYKFFGLLDLPIIPGHTISSKRDSIGNLVVTWSVPYEISKTIPNVPTSIRVTLRALNSVIPTALYVRVPSHGGVLFIPANVVDLLLTQASKFNVEVQLRTNDYNNRSYSRQKRIRL